MSKLIPILPSAKTKYGIAVRVGVYDTCIRAGQNIVSQSAAATDSG